MVKVLDSSIVINNKDISKLDDVFIQSIEFEDKIGFLSDQVTIKLIGKYPVPPHKTQMSVSFGHKDKLFKAGHFYVNTTTQTKNSLIIKATGTNFSGSLKEKKSNTYNSKSIKDIVSTIALASSLDSSCDVDIKQEVLYQRDQSDLEFLQKISNDNGLIFNIKNQTIVCRKMDIEKLPSVDINSSDLDDLQITNMARDIYKCCVVSYHDSKQNKNISIRFGDGEPTYKINTNFINPNEAKEFAKNTLHKVNRNTRQGQFSCAGFNIYAGNVLNIDDDKFIVNTVRHTFNSEGWKTRINFHN